MRKGRSFLCMLLIFTLVIGMFLPAAAAAAPVLTVTPSVKSIDQGSGTANVVYTISLDPKGNSIAAFQFTLAAPEGMKLASNRVGTQGGAGYWLNSSEISCFSLFSYTPSTGYFGASGGTEGSTLDDAATIMTIQATVEIGAVKTYTLGVTGFICGGVGSVDQGGTVSVGDVKIVASSSTPIPTPTPTPTPSHACPVCNGCTDTKCATHKDKCLLLTMSFADVKKGQWYTPGVEYVYHHGLMIGTADGLFQIYGTTNRAMVVTVLWRMAGEPAATGANPFTDVPKGQWYTDAVIWAASKGIVDGYGDGRFGPMDSINREQMAKILYGYAKSQGCDVSAKADLSPYTDAGKLSSWAKTPMSWAVAEGLIQGVGEGFIDPKGNALRSQVATLVMRFCQNVL